MRPFGWTTLSLSSGNLMSQYFSTHELGLPLAIFYDAVSKGNWMQRGIIHTCQQSIVKISQKTNLRRSTILGSTLNFAQSRSD